MVSMYSTKEEKALATMRQIKSAILQLQEWNAGKRDVNDFLTSPEGMKDLAASSMLMEAIGEGFKNIDKLTDGKLLPLRPEIPWKEVKGMRDKIAHGYFDIDASIVFEAVKYDLPELMPAVEFFIDSLNQTTSPDTPS